MNKKITKKSYSYSSFINYEHFAKTYLLCAKILLEAKVSTKKRSTRDQWRIDTGLIYIPIIYSIRHSIELFLKSIDVGNSNSYIKRHNLEELKKDFDSLNLKLSNIEKTRLEQIIDKYIIYGFDIDIVNVTDTENDIFRFPDNSAKVKIKGENLSKLQVSELLRDIDILDKLYVRISAKWQLQKK